jgi:hypothetical protein
MALVLQPEAKAIVFIVSLAVTMTGPEYTGELVVGVAPLVV